MTITYNKPASRQGSILIEQVIAPVRGAACGRMNWHECFFYDSENGCLIWRTRPPEHFLSHSRMLASNRRLSGKVAGTVAGTVRGKQYVRVRVTASGAKSTILAHRIIWEMHHGPIPEGIMVDHIDRNPRNNRIENLRLATAGESVLNRCLQRNNTTGFRGVVFTAGKYQASISVRGKNIYLGRFDTAEMAAEAYAKASESRISQFVPEKLNR